MTFETHKTPKNFPTNVDHFHSYTIMSTGGTAVTLGKAGISVKKVEELTAFPEMVGKKRSNKC